MLTISKPLSASQARTYHAREFAAQEQNYWSRDQQGHSEWQGRLAEQWGLHGAVGFEHFARLSEGQHPETEAQLVRYQTAKTYEGKYGKEVTSVEHRAGWDATFSAPKSVSLTALVGGDERVREAHRESVRMALSGLERYTQARIGNVHAPETTGKFIAATFEHDTARPVDGYAAPQLHTHAVIFNVTERENGETRALQPHEMFVSQRYTTAVYRSELALRLERLGYELERGKYGQPEIQGYTKEYLEASSLRREQIKDHLRESRESTERQRLRSPLTSTRDRKELLSPEEVLRQHRELAAQYGHQADRVVAEAREHEKQQRQRHDYSPRASRAAVRDLCPRPPLRAVGGCRPARHFGSGAQPWNGRKSRLLKCGRSSSAECRRASSAPSNTLLSTMGRASSTRPPPCCAWSARPSPTCKRATGAVMTIRCWFREEFVLKPNNGTRS